MIERTARIVNQQGLHARPAALIVRLASRFGSDITLSRDGNEHGAVNAKSIMGVMMLAAGQGSTVALEASGADAEQALAALLQLIRDKFGEGE